MGTALILTTFGALLSQASIGEQPGQADLERALLAREIRVLTFPAECRRKPARGCIKPPKRIKVRNFDCQATGTGEKGEPIVFCRVTYIRAGGDLAYVQSNDECVPLRSFEMDGVEHGTTYRDWEALLIDAKGRCPGGR